MENIQSLQQLFAQATKEAFRLELLDYYRIEGEWDLYQQYLQGKPKPRDEDFEAFCTTIRHLIQQGRKQLTVHVVTRKLHPYIKFEILWYYQERAKAGEDIYLLYRDIYEKLSSDFSPPDFWIFDNTIVAELKYDKLHRFRNWKRIDNPKLVSSYINLKEKVLPHAIPLLDFTM